MINQCTLMGRLVADPEYRTTTSGVAVTRIRIAIDRDYAKEGEERKRILSPAPHGAQRPISSQSISTRGI